MRKIKRGSIGVIVLIAAMILIFSFNREKMNKVETVSNLASKVNVSIEELEKQQVKALHDGLYSYIGMDSDQLLSILGEPNRIDRSSYDYDWWIYNENSNNYVQIGIENDRVVTTYGIGNDVNIEPFHIGQPVDEINAQKLIKSKVKVSSDKKFVLTDEEMKSRPLVAIGDVFAQLYFDTFTKKLSSIRFMDEDTLIKQRPYELVYRGELISAKKLSPEEWKKVEEGNTSQIFDITNVIRVRHHLPPVKWDIKTAEVAYNHSKDMNINDYFSHTSPTNEGLAERLLKGEVSYNIAGENIAAKYVDGIAVVEGWLNSKGHRETLLNEEYNYIGVGVFEKYYTQNFIQKGE